MNKKELENIIERYRFYAGKAPDFMRGQKVKIIGYDEVLVVKSVFTSHVFIGYKYELIDDKNRLWNVYEYDLKLFKE